MSDLRTPPEAAPSSSPSERSGGDSVTLIERLLALADNIKHATGGLRLDFFHAGPSTQKLLREAADRLAVLELRESERSKGLGSASALEVEAGGLESDLEMIRRSVTSRLEKVEVLTYLMSADTADKYLTPFRETLRALDRVTVRLAAATRPEASPSPEGGGAGSESMWNLRTLAKCLLETPYGAPINEALARDLAREALESSRPVSTDREEGEAQEKEGVWIDGKPYKGEPLFPGLGSASALVAEAGEWPRSHARDERLGSGRERSSNECCG